MQKRLWFVNQDHTRITRYNLGYYAGKGFYAVARVTDV